MIEKLGPITTIGINRPQKRNCVNTAVALSLSNAITQFEEDETSYVGVLYGIGGNFCAGYDLAELSGAEDGSSLTFDFENGRGPMVCHICSLCLEVR